MPAQVITGLGTTACAVGALGVGAAGRKTAAGRITACRRMSMSLMMFFLIRAKRVKSLDVAGGYVFARMLEQDGIANSFRDTL